MKAGLVYSLKMEGRLLPERLNLFAFFNKSFQSLYLFGAFSPIDGNSFLLELPSCNSDNFQLFLNEFSLQRPDEFKVMVWITEPLIKQKNQLYPIILP